MRILRTRLCFQWRFFFIFFFLLFYQQSRQWSRNVPLFRACYPDFLFFFQSKFLLVQNVWKRKDLNGCQVGWNRQSDVGWGKDASELRAMSSHLIVSLNLIQSKRVISFNWATIPCVTFDSERVILLNPIDATPFRFYACSSLSFGGVI